MPTMPHQQQPHQQQPHHRRRLQAVNLALRTNAAGVAPSPTAAAAEAAAAAAVLLPEEPVLSPRDLELWEERGWMVLKGAASKEDCAAVVDHMCAAMGMSLSDPASWHREGGPAELTEDGELLWDPTKPTPIHHAVPVQNTQAQWNIRTSPRVHAAFAQIYGTSRLWCMPSGVATMKPPWRSDRRRFEHICHAGKQPWFGLGDALPMHWDVSTEQMFDGGYGGTFTARPEPGFPLPTCRYRPPGCIGFLMLNDRTEFGGQTAVVPKFHRYFNKWAGLDAAQSEIERMRQPESRQHPEMTQILRSIDEVSSKNDPPTHTPHTPRPTLREARRRWRLLHCISSSVWPSSCNGSYPLFCSYPPCGSDCGMVWSGQVFDEREGPAEIVVPSGEAGDLVIIDSFLCHGSGKNTMDTPRFTMWVTSSPIPDDLTERETQRAKRVEAFAEQGGWKPVRERGTIPSLTPLGEKLVGIQPWDDG
jgi:hypothetical protein